MKFTVLLARPSYITTGALPVETFSYHAIARDVHEATIQAQYAAAEADNVHEDDHGDYYPIVVYPGHLESLT